MQDITPFLVVPCLLVLYGIYLAIAAFVSDFVYFLAGIRIGKIEIRAMDSQEIRIKTSLTGVLWIVSAIFVLFVTTQGQFFHMLSPAKVQPADTHVREYAPPNATNVNGMRAGTVFEILRIEPQLGVIRSTTWDEKSKRSVRQIYSVDVAPDGDIHAAVIARIVAVMRENNQSNVPWNSSRLGRVVVLSTRQQDDAALRHFLAMEFFGDEISDFKSR
jgi:hypothetical protein